MKRKAKRQNKALLLFEAQGEAAKQSTALFAVQGGAVAFEMDCFCDESCLSAESEQVSR
ncbi:hypothetical protein [Acinetobacter sp.]|uniref:hypothetical protein n=1 Tax=Acinetobacter sp. TaxID=472 RepID=UPI0035B30192